MRTLAPLLLILAALPLFAASSCEEKTDADTAPLPVVGFDTSVAVEADGWTLTARNAYRTARIGDRKPLGTFVVVELSLTNTAKEKQALCGNRFKLLDEGGSTYSHDEAATIAAGQQQLCKDINPGLSGAARVAFDVPADAGPLTLRGVGGFRVAIGAPSGLATR